MSKSDIWQFDPVDANNTDIEGIDVNTGWSPNQVGPSFRALMGRLARVCQGLAPWLAAIIDGAAATVRPLYFSTAFSTNGSAGYRWLVGANATAESGGNAGSDLNIIPYSDSGSALPTAVTITRSTGLATFRALTTNNTFTANGPNNAINFTTNNALTLSQNLIGGPACTGLTVNLGSTTSNMAVWQYGGSPVGSITTNGSTTSYNTTSDYRLKITFGEAAPILSSLTVHNAAWKSDPDGVRRPMILAHELSEIAPWAVIGEKDGEEIQQVDYLALIPALLSHIQFIERRLSAAGF